LVFFSPRSDIEWSDVENEIIHFPFIKTMLKTSMSGTGYISFAIPGKKANVLSFLDGIDALSKEFFEYSSVHQELRVGAAANLSLYNDGKWIFPDEIREKIFASDVVSIPPHVKMLPAGGVQTDFNHTEFEIASIAKLASRSSPGELLVWAKRRNLDVNSKKIAAIIRKLYKRRILQAYTDFSVGLSSNFCFEVVCNAQWKVKILSILEKLPYAIFLESPRGIIVWVTAPSYHQVEYYQLFRSLEQEDGVKSVQSIMTIRGIGSRSILDLIKDWTFTNGHFSVPNSRLDITKYVSF